MLPRRDCNPSIASDGTRGGRVVVCKVLTNPPTAGNLTLFLNAQRVVHYDISFGDTYGSSPGHTTRVLLDRLDGNGFNDSYMVGSLTSTYNQ